MSKKYVRLVIAGGLNRDFFTRWGFDRGARRFLDAVAEAAHDLLIKVEGQYTYYREEGSSLDAARNEAEEYAMERSLEDADGIVYDLSPHERWSAWVEMGMYEFPGELKNTAQFSMAERSATPTLAMATMMHYDLIEFAQTAIYDLSTENLPPQ